MTALGGIEAFLFPELMRHRVEHPFPGVRGIVRAGPGWSGLALVVLVAAFGQRGVWPCDRVVDVGSHFGLCLGF